jgi:site-specific recombinase XerD
MKELEMYQNYLKSRGKSANTLRAFTTNINEFLEITDSKTIEDLNEIKVVDMNSYLITLQNKGNGDSTRNAKVSAVKSFFKFLNKIELMDRNVAEKIDLSKVASKPSVQPTREEAKKILDSVKSRPKLFVLYTLLMNSGMRIEECLQLRIKDFRDNRLYVLGKGNKYRTIPLNQYAVATLQKYIDKQRKQWTKEMLMERHHDADIVAQAMKDNDLIFLGKNGFRMFNNNLNVSLTRTAKICGISKDKVHPHAFRHYFANEFVEQGGRVNELQTILGHSSIKTTQIYFNTNLTQVQNTMNAMSF